MRLIIFDFDGTIHRKETPRLFLRVLREEETKRKMVAQFYRAVAGVYILYRLGAGRELMRRRVPNGIARIMEGMSRVEVEGFFEKCLPIAKENFSPAALQRVRAHLDAGDRILLLSGAFAPFVASVARDLGIHHWLGTELAVAADGRCAGRIQTLLIGPPKVQALNTFLREQKQAGNVFDLAEAYAYADGLQDLPLLTRVGHPVAVNPDRGLGREARKRGWEIIADEAAAGDH